MKTEIVFIDEETLTGEELAEMAESQTPSHLERYLEEVSSHGQASE